LNYSGILKALKMREFKKNKFVKFEFSVYADS